MLIYLVRHGLADLTTGIPYHIAPGPPLSAEGQEQAEEAARVLQFSGAGTVVSSPMNRCVATVEPLCMRLELDLVTDEDLGEAQPGESLPAITIRMLRAVITHCNAAPTILVSHSAPLEQLILALTRGTATLSPPDARGARIGTAHVWRLGLREGQWQAHHLPVGGVLV